MSVAATSFAIFAISQVGTPGPANMAILAASARYGFRAVLPFLTGIILGKQLIIWPVGYGLMTLAAKAPWVFEGLKWVSAIYIIWLAWRIATMKLEASYKSNPPGFLAGLFVHPLNPKAWAMILAGFTAFTAPAMPTFQTTATIATILFGSQVVLHPVWASGGAFLSRTVAGTGGEKYLMWTLAALTVASVFFVLFRGET